MNFKLNTTPNPFFLFISILFLFSCKEINEKVNQDDIQDTTFAIPETIKLHLDSTIKNLPNLITDSVKISQHLEIDNSKKYIYLTFDDGPQHGTVASFELCKKLNVKSTFFMVAFHASSPNLKNIVRLINDDYPRTLLGNHSRSHARNKYQSFYHNDSLAVEDLFFAQKILNVPFKIIRLPGSNSWLIENRMKTETLARNVCKRMDTSGYNIVGWDMEWNFFAVSANPIQSADEMIEKVKHRFETNKLYTPNHLVILMHDRMFRNPNYTDSLHKFISTLQKDTNYIFETVDHYPGLKPLN